MLNGAVPSINWLLLWYPLTNIQLRKSLIYFCSINKYNCEQKAIMDFSSFVNDYKTKFIKVLEGEWEYKLYKHMSLTFFFIILEGFEKAGIHDIT